MWQKHQSGKAVDYLAMNAKDKRVLVLGGGDTGVDCIGTALRQVKDDVTTLPVSIPLSLPLSIPVSLPVSLSVSFRVSLPVSLPVSIACIITCIINSSLTVSLPV